MSDKEESGLKVALLGILWKIGVISEDEYYASDVWTYYL